MFFTILCQSIIDRPDIVFHTFDGISIRAHFMWMYRTIEGEREDLRIAGCWSHARRRFDEAVKALPKAKQKDSRAYLALTMIQAIYREKKLLKDLPSRRT